MSLLLHADATDAVIDDVAVADAVTSASAYDIAAAAEGTDAASHGTADVHADATFADAAASESIILLLRLMCSI